MIPIALTPSAGDGTTTVFTAAGAVASELLLVDRLPQISGVDYTPSVVAGNSVYTFAVAPPATAILTLLGNLSAVIQAGTGAASAKWDTAGTIINDAAVECGLTASPDPFASLDPNFVRLCKLLKSCGREMVNKADWSHLDTEYIWTTVAGEQTYPLPPDYRSMYDQSGWNRTSRLPLGGPLSPQEWQFLAARQIGVSWTILFRPAQGQLQAFPAQGATPSSMNIAFEYRSSWWVGLAASAYNPRGAWSGNTAIAVGDTMTNGGNTYVCVLAGKTSAVAGAPGPTNFGAFLDGTAVWKLYLAGTGFNPTNPTSAAPTSSADIIYLDPLAIMRRLKADFLGDMGFGSSKAESQAVDALTDAIANDKASPTLSLNRSRRGERMLSSANIPLTGFGQ